MCKQDGVRGELSSYFIAKQADFFQNHWVYQNYHITHELRILGGKSYCWERYSKSGIFRPNRDGWQLCLDDNIIYAWQIFPIENNQHFQIFLNTLWVKYYADSIHFITKLEINLSKIYILVYENIFVIKVINWYGLTTSLDCSNISKGSNTSSHLWI